MTEVEWLSGTHFAELLHSQRGKVSNRKLRLFACACCRRLWDAIIDDKSRQRVEITERYADDKIVEWAFLEAFRADEVVGKRQDFRTALRMSINALGWPDTETPNHGWDEAANDIVEKEWEPGEYAEHFTIRTSLFAANASALREIGHRAHPGEKTGDVRAAMSRAYATQADILRDLLGNPFRPVHFSPNWRTGTATALARQMYEGREFSAMPILADALQDAGCEDEQVLTHCRNEAKHVRGCWVVDLVLDRP